MAGQDQADMGLATTVALGDVLFVRGSPGGLQMVGEGRSAGMRAAMQSTLSFRCRDDDDTPF